MKRPITPKACACGVGVVDPSRPAAKWCDACLDRKKHAPRGHKARTFARAKLQIQHLPPAPSVPASFRGPGGIMNSFLASDICPKREFAVNRATRHIRRGL